MSKKIFFSVFLIVLLLLSGTSKADVEHVGQRAYWSDLDTINHNWGEPNNWWTLDIYYDTITEEYDYVKAEINEVPDINTQAFIGKGSAHADYPTELFDLIEGGFVMTDPTIDSGTFDVNYVLCNGGQNLSGSSGDPNRDHYLTVTGGTLNVGYPQTWEGYEWLDDNLEFWGQWGSGRLCIGIAEGGSGTMNMTDGTVNVGGHMEVGSWMYSYGELNLYGGEINIIQGFYCPGSLWGPTGQANLRGGTINAKYLYMFSTNPGGTIDFAGGIMKLEGDKVEDVNNYAGGNVAGATITAHGVPSGEIVTDPNSPENGKRAFLNIAYGIDEKTTVQAVTTDVDQAWGPIPADGSADVRGPADDLTRPKLEWSPGDSTATRDVYFGTDFDQVNDANDPDPDPNVFMVTLSSEDVNYVHDEDLKSLTTYYWRIDEVKSNQNVTKGSVWSFTNADFEKAAHPVPHDGATNVFPAELTWTPGIYAVSHDVYFSSEFNDVNERDPNFMDNVGTSVYPLTGLQFDTTYYWRVDEVNSLGIPYPGDVWTFTITDHINIDDMDQYNTTNNPIAYEDETRGTWKDYSYNGTEAEIFVESSITYGGTEKSMEFNYENEFSGGLYYCEAEADIADLEIGPDWTVGGAEAVVIYFYGQSGNMADANNQMYFAVEDTDSNMAVITYPDVTDLQQAEWHQWNISLQQFIDEGVDVTDIETVYLGFGDRTLSEPSGNPVNESVVYFDEIEVRPRRCTAVTSYPYGDINGDCIVDNNDLVEMVEDWLVSDYNTVGFDGELWNFPAEGEPNYNVCWVEGRTEESGDYALEFGSEHPRDLNEWPEENDDFVKVPPLNWFSNTMTITAWVKRHGLQRDDSAIFYCDGVYNDPIWEGDTVAGFNIGCESDNSLGYNWPTSKGQAYTWNPAIAPLPHNEWAFCAMVIEPDTARIYIKLPGEDLDDDFALYPHLAAKFDIPSTIGHHKWRNFDGVMDDLRIFKDPIPYYEILWLATDGTGDGAVEPNTPYVWYKFDDGTGLVAKDSGEGALMYHPNPSKANLYEDEPIYQRHVNFKDYSVLADNWLRDLTFPIE